MHVLSLGGFVALRPYVTGAVFVPPDPPTVDPGGCILLKANDNTWHWLCLFQDEGLIILTVNQTNEANPGTLGFIVFNASDSSHHVVDLMVDEGIYFVRINQTATGLAANYTNLPLGYGTAARHNVSLVLDENYTLYVNQTPNP